VIVIAAGPVLVPVLLAVVVAICVGGDLGLDLLHVERLGLGDQLLERGGWKGAGLAEQQDAVAKQHQRRNGLDVGGSGDLALGFRVDLAEGDITMSLGGALEDRSKGFAWAAPFGPEIEEHDTRLLDRRLKVARGDLNSCHRHNMACRGMDCKRPQTEAGCIVEEVGVLGPRNGEAVRAGYNGVMQKPHVPASHGRQAAIVLVGSVAITLAMFLIPSPERTWWLLAPFRWLHIYVHEFGHGIAALISGGKFDSFEMYTYSGVAHVWTRTPFGWGFGGAVAALSLLVAFKAKPALAQMVLVFLGVQLALSVYTGGGYLFVRSAEIQNGYRGPSDTQAMADALGLPYWFWGGACAAFSVIVLLAGLWIYVKPQRARIKPVGHGRLAA